MVSLYLPRIAAAIGGAVVVSALVAAWLVVRGDDLDARRWLEDQGVGSAIAKALWPILLKLWSAAYELGEAAARKLAGGPGALAPVGELIETEGRAWLNEIVSTRLVRIARILSRGGTQVELTAEIQALLADEESAEMVAQTEVTRAVSAGAVSTYKTQFLTEFIWVVEDYNACEECLTNAAAGPRFYGNPYPSGAIEPPQHPRCRCALIPAKRSIA